MEKEFECRGKCFLIHIGGEVDHYKTDKIRAMCDVYLEGTRIRHVIFDFKNVHFMDSSGIGMIMGRYKQVKRLGGKIYIINAGKEVDRILTISGLSKLVVKRNSVEEVYEEVENEK